MVDVKLITLLKVYETGNYTRAAEKLSLTQPAVSQHIKQLEREMNAVIFDRAGSKIRPTPEGRLIIQYAERVVSLYETLQQALQLSQAAEFVDRYPEKAAHPIAQLGRNVSGGQKQRLSIARALARRPEILIFDDSFSALDYKTDATLREGLAKQLPGTTKIIVAQRISTIRHADQILVLDRGEIAGLGTHDALMASCPVYREIAMSQLSEEELKKGGASK